MYRETFSGIVNLKSGVLFDSSNSYEWEKYQNWLSGDTIEYRYNKSKYEEQSKEYNEWLEISTYDARMQEYKNKLGHYDMLVLNIIKEKYPNYSMMVEKYIEDLEQYSQELKLYSENKFPYYPVKPRNPKESILEVIEIPEPPKPPEKPKGYYSIEDANLSKHTHITWLDRKKNYKLKYPGDFFDEMEPVILKMPSELKAPPMEILENPIKKPNTPLKQYTKEEWSEYKKKQIELSITKTLSKGYKTSLDIIMDCDIEDIQKIISAYTYYSNNNAQTMLIRDYHNEVHSLNIDDVNKIIKELTDNYQSLIQYKWSSEKNIDISDYCSHKISYGSI